MKRRNFLGAAGVTLVAPSLVRAQSARTLTYVPSSDIASLDQSTAYSRSLTGISRAGVDFSSVRRV